MCLGYLLWSSSGLLSKRCCIEVEAMNISTGSRKEKVAIERLRLYLLFFLVQELKRVLKGLTLDFVCLFSTKL